MPNTNYTLNYPILIDSMQKYMLRTDNPFVDQIPYLIQQGVIRVYNNAKDLGFEIRTEIINNTIGSNSIRKPGNWRETISILMFDNATRIASYLLPRSREFNLTYWPAGYLNQTGRPKYYNDGVHNLNNVDIANTYGQFYWNVIPNLDQAYTFDIIYLGIPLFNSILAVEKPFEIPIEDTVMVIGYIDRIQVDPDGILHVIDYKTSKDKKYLAKDFFQLLTYAYHLYLEDPSITKIRGSYVMIKHKFDHITKEFTLKDILETKQIFSDYAKNIREEKLFRANVTPLCGYCSFLDSCKEGTNYINKQKGFGQISW